MQTEPVVSAACQDYQAIPRNRFGLWVLSRTSTPKNIGGAPVFFVDSVYRAKEHLMWIQTSSDVHKTEKGEEEEQHGPK